MGITSWTASGVLGKSGSAGPRSEGKHDGVWAFVFIAVFVVLPIIVTVVLAWATISTANKPFDPATCCTLACRSTHDLPRCR